MVSLAGFVPQKPDSIAAVRFVNVSYFFCQISALLTAQVFYRKWARISSPVKGESCAGAMSNTVLAPLSPALFRRYAALA